MSKLNFRKMTRVVAGVTLVTATTMGCSEDATTPNVITEGINYIPGEVDGGATPVLKNFFTIPNFFTFLNQYSNDLPAMVSILEEFETDFYLASHKYFYLLETSSVIIYNIQERGGLLAPLTSHFKSVMEYAIQEGTSYATINFTILETDWKWNDPTEDIPEFSISEYADPLNPVPFPVKENPIHYSLEVSVNSNGDWTVTGRIGGSY